MGLGDERADGGYREPQLPRPVPPIYLALDLWQAMGLDSREFDAYYERNGWANTWPNLLGAVRTKFGRRAVCPYAVEDGEDCVLLMGHFGPHMGESDVGSSEPLPHSTDPHHEFGSRDA